MFRGTERGAATVSLLGDIVNQASRRTADREAHAMGRRVPRSS